MAARARTWRLKFLRAVIAAFHALSDGSPATSHEAIGLRQRPETLVPLPPTGDRAGDGRGRFGVGHAVGHHAVTRRLRQHPSTRPAHRRTADGWRETPQFNMLILTEKRPVASGRTPSNSPSTTALRSSASADPTRVNWSAPSARSTSSTTPARTSSTASSATTSSWTPPKPPPDPPAPHPRPTRHGRLRRWRERRSRAGRHGPVGARSVAVRVRQAELPPRVRGHRRGDRPGRSVVCSAGAGFVVGVALPVDGGCVAR